MSLLRGSWKTFQRTERNEKLTGAKVNILSGLFKTMSHVKNFKAARLHERLFQMLNVTPTRNEGKIGLCKQELAGRGGTPQISPHTHGGLKNSRSPRGLRYILISGVRTGVEGCIIRYKSQKNTSL